MTPENIKEIVEQVINDKTRFYPLYVFMAILISCIIVVVASYLKLKGENYATKQDIKELTDKVESVKFDYLKKIEEYKGELNLKYELEKTLVNSKVEAYQITTSLKVAIIRRKNLMGNERELNEKFFGQIPELMINLSSQVQLRDKFTDELKSLEISYNEIVTYINNLKASGAKTYSINLDEIEKTLDRIQLKLLQ